MDNCKLYIGNLPWTATEDDLRGLFGPLGEIRSVSVILDRDTGKSRGFGFVEMGNRELATNAASKLNGTMLKGRPLLVREAKPENDLSKKIKGFMDSANLGDKLELDFSGKHFLIVCQ